MFGVAHVPGHGAGLRLHGRKTSTPWVGGLSGAACAARARRMRAARARLPVPARARTLAPFARNAPASAAVAAMIVLPRARDAPSVRSKPCSASRFGLAPLTTYWLTAGCVLAAAAAGVSAHAATQAATTPTFLLLTSPPRSYVM